MPLKEKARRPNQWEVFRRLRSAGCPVDLEHLPLPSYPLSVSNLDNNLSTGIYPLPGATGIVLALRIVATSRLTITYLGLRANWLSQPVSWLERCPRHPRAYETYYCFHDCAYGYFRMASSSVLNWLQNFGTLKPGVRLFGCLMGVFSGVLPATAPEKLEATLVVRDLAGDEHPFQVWIANTKPQDNAFLRGQAVEPSQPSAGNHRR